MEVAGYLPRPWSGEVNIHTTSHRHWEGTPGKHFAPNLRQFGVARSEELGVNQWKVQDIHWLSSQSEQAKNIIHYFSIY